MAELVHPDGERRRAWPAFEGAIGKVSRVGSGVPMSSAMLDALGDEPSRTILRTAISSGKTIEQIAEEQGLALSTCYRRVRKLVDMGLMLLERTVVTRAGKRFGVYRTAFATATVWFDAEEVRIEVSPNPDVVDKLRAKILETTFPRDGGKAFGEPGYVTGRAGRSPFE